ncbi:MAG: flagellar biosynthesis anti-sigma factor FlgM [Chloroflexi bacterium]|nr:flagellar biosynthesis anti-sigma factor FlgM [Chloroflexota bacterium]
MRIDETLGTSTRTASIQPGHPESARQPRSSQEPGQPLGTQVEVSQEGRAINRARQLAAATPEVRADRVAALRAQIEAGTYRVDSRDLARRILEEISGAGA